MLPDEPTLRSYGRLFAELAFSRFLVNAVFVATGQTLLTLLFCSVARYAFAEYVVCGMTLGAVKE
jgi:ABC-type glycerol-3-phosphate transport system permease component